MTETTATLTKGERTRRRIVGHATQLIHDQGYRGTTIDDVIKAAESWASDLQLANKPVLNIGAAVTIGQIVFGAVGDATRMEYTVIGDAVNLAAKLEKHAKVESVRALCTASAWEAALQQGYRPVVAPRRLDHRVLEGVCPPQDIVVIAN